MAARAFFASGAARSQAVRTTLQCVVWNCPAGERAGSELSSSRAMPGIVRRRACEVAGRGARAAGLPIALSPRRSFASLGVLGLLLGPNPTLTLVANSAETPRAADSASQG